MKLEGDMTRVFGAAPGKWADACFWACGLAVLDIKKFERFLKREHGYRDDGEACESINEFVERKFGKQAVALLDGAAGFNPRGRAAWRPAP